MLFRSGAGADADAGAGAGACAGDGAGAGLEPVADIEVHASSLRGIEVPHHLVALAIDEFPIFFIAAACATGRTILRGAAELRVKETDWVAALARNLRALGVTVEDGADSLAVQGTEATLAGAVDAFGDHRIAMAFGILGALPGNRVDVQGAESVGISYPRFWEELKRVNRAMEST